MVMSPWHPYPAGCIGGFQVSQVTWPGSPGPNHPVEYKNNNTTAVAFTMTYFSFQILESMMYLVSVVSSCKKQLYT